MNLNPWPAISCERHKKKNCGANPISIANYAIFTWLFHNFVAITFKLVIMKLNRIKTDVLVYAFDKSEIDAWRLISDVVTGHYV